MRIAKWYKLYRDGEFYFLYRDRCSFIPNDHATKLTSALCKLSKPAAEVLANAKTKVVDNKACVQPVMSTVSNTEETVERTPGLEESASLAESKITEHHDGKVLAACGSVLPDADASLPHDIQIHVQRPSPVREIPGSRQKLASAGTGSDLKADEQEVQPVRNTVELDTEVIVNESTAAEESSVMSTDKNERALSALTSVSSTVVRTDQEVDMQRVRPISGPATDTCAERPEFDFVRKSHSVTDSLYEEGEDGEFVVHSRGSCVRAFARSTGLGSGKDSIRRIHSSVGFDRPSLKSLSLSFDVDESADSSVRSAPVQPGAGHKTNLTGLRSRHTSGLETPMSALDTSSVTSMSEAGTAAAFCHH